MLFDLAVSFSLRIQKDHLGLVLRGFHFTFQRCWAPAAHLRQAGCLEQVYSVRLRVLFQNWHTVWLFIGFVMGSISGIFGRLKVNELTHI